MADSPTAYVVLHQLGPHMPGEVLTFSDAHTAAPTRDGKGGLGINLDRLVALGSVREASDQEAKRAVEFGTGPSAEDIIPFPEVPFNPTVPAPAEISPEVALTTGASVMGAGTADGVASGGTGGDLENESPSTGEGTDASAEKPSTRRRS